jgi:hypothetical protein
VGGYINKPIFHDLTAANIMRLQIINEEQQLLFRIPMRDTSIAFVVKT